METRSGKAYVRFGVPSITIFGRIEHYQDLGSPHVNASGNKRGVANVHLSAGGDVVANGQKLGIGSASISGHLGLRITAYKLTSGHAHASSLGGSIEAVGTKIAVAPIRITAGGTVTATSTGYHYGLASVSGGVRIRLVTTGPLWNLRRSTVPEWSTRHPVEPDWAIIEPIATRR